MDKARDLLESGRGDHRNLDADLQRPIGWSAGSPITWSFQWLRNGEPIAGATSAEYTVQSADTDPPSVLQCAATAEDAEGGQSGGLLGS